MADLIQQNAGVRTQTPAQEIFVEDASPEKHEVVTPFSEDTLTVKAKKDKPLGSQVLAPPGTWAYEPAVLATAAEGASRSQPINLSFLDKITSWWSDKNAEAEAVTAASEPVPIEPVAAATQEGTEKSYYEGLTDWAGNICNYFSSFFGSGEVPAAPASDAASGAKFLSPLSPRERAELDKLMRIFTKIMARISETLSEADLDQLMETIVLMAHHSKNEEFHLQKANLMKKLDTLKEAQVKRMKDMDIYIDQLRMNKYWGRCEELTSSIGLVSGMAMAGPGWAFAATMYVIGKAANSYADNPLEHGMSRAIAWTEFGSVFGVNKRDTEQTAYNMIKLGIGILTSIASYPLGFGPTNAAMTMQALVSAGRGFVQHKADKTQGELDYQGFIVRDSREQVTKAQSGLAAKSTEITSVVWKAASRHARSTHDAMINMNR